MISATLFDLDGVLIDSIEVWFRVMSDLATESGTGPIARERFDATWGQGVEADIAAFYYGRSVEQVESFYRTHFMDHIDHLLVIPGALELFRRLRDRRCSAAVITNTPTRLAEKILEHVGISPDVLVGSTDVAESKPAPDMVFRACALLEVDPRSAVVIGDSEYDRAAAAAAGVRFVGYRLDGDSRIESLDQILPLERLESRMR